MGGPNTLHAIQFLVNYHILQCFGILAEADELVFASTEVLEIAFFGHIPLTQHLSPDLLLLVGVFAAAGNHVGHNLLTIGLVSMAFWVRA